MRKKWYIILVMVLILLNINVYADDVCETSELTRLRKLAEKVEFSYDYEIKSNNGYKYIEYSITAYNLDNDLKVLIIEDYYNNKYKEFKYNDSKEATLKSFYSGNNVEITIMAYSNNGCSGKVLLTKKIKVPYYNVYSESKYCVKDNPLLESKCCGTIIDNYFKDDDSFLSCISDFGYKYNLTLDDDFEIVYNSNDSIVKYIISGVLIGCVVVIFIVVVIKKVKKNRL